MQRSFTDWGGNLAAFAVTILLNVLSNALPINGQSMQAISAKYPSLFTPAGFTFGIWGVIYALLLAFVIWQALPAQRSSTRLARVSVPFKINCLANAAWIVAWHYDLLPLSLLLILTVLGTLMVIYRVLIDQIETAPLIEHFVLYMPFSVYTGWLALATIANASVLQTAYGWDHVAMPAIQWTLLKLAVAGAVGATMLLRFRDVPFAMAVAWGAYGISVMQSATPAVSGAAVTLSLLLLLLAALDGVRRLRNVS